VSAYQLFTTNTSEDFLTAGLITAAVGGILDLIGTIYLQNAKEHIFDAVWEYNQNIKN